jgi:hypothetical protein
MEPAPPFAILSSINYKKEIEKIGYCCMFLADD